jgi:hypothetical protein
LYDPILYGSRIQCLLRGHLVAERAVIGHEEIQDVLEPGPGCEHGNKSLPPDSTKAMICTFERTFCNECVDGILEHVCPDCGGGLFPRPIWPKGNLKNDNYPGKYPLQTSHP